MLQVLWTIDLKSIMNKIYYCNDMMIQNKQVAISKSYLCIELYSPGILLANAHLHHYPFIWIIHLIHL